MRKELNLSEHNLDTDISLLSRDIVHEFFVVCRKAGIYSIHHPMVTKAVSRPFLGFQKIFQFKKYFCFYLREGELFVNNILMKDIGVSDYLKEKMYELEIVSILFDDSVTSADLEVFIDRFVKKVPTSSGDYFMHKYLEARRVGSIKVNDPLAEKLFRCGLHYRDEVGEDHTARRLVANFFSGDTSLAVEVLSTNFEDTAALAEATGIDYHVELIRHVLPEKFAQLLPSELLGIAEEILESNPGLNDTGGTKMERLVKACDYHPKRDEILEKIRAKFIERGVDEQLFAKSLSQVGSLKLEAANSLDKIYCLIFSEDFEPKYYSEFHDAFMRLVRTRQMGKAAGSAEAIIEQLASDSAIFRQHAIYLLEDIIKVILSVGEYDFFDVALRHMQSLFTQGRETFEFSQVASLLLKTMLGLRRFEPVAAFLNILKAGRKFEGGATFYDSLIIKRIFDDLGNSDLIIRLVHELVQPGNNLIRPIRDILIAIQSEIVALKLSEIVTHPERAIRQHSLKILSESGRPAVKVFSDILRDEANFLRGENRHELPDEKWFLIRNAIFVLGNLGSQEACHAMRLRLADPDIRVRRELVGALEKIGGDEATDLLMILAEDFDQTVREAAIIALGLFKRAELVPFFADLLFRFRGETSRIISAIASASSNEGREYLQALLKDENRLKMAASGRASVKEIRQMISKALERAGGEEGSKADTELKTKTDFSSSVSGIGKTAKSLFGRLQPKK